MEKAPTSVGCPVFYAGRFIDRVADAGLPHGCILLGDWDVLPAQLAEATEGATSLVVVDLLSFPFEALTGALRDIPLILVLPSGRDLEFLTTVFGQAVFGHLTFFDRVATPDPDVWKALRRRYGWGEGQRVGIESGDPAEAAAEIGALLESESSTPAFSGAAPAGSVPHREVFGVCHGPDFNKAVHRVQRRALVPQFAAARGARAEDVPFDVLEVGVGAGRWVASFDLANTGFFGLDIGEDMVSAARANFPEGNFDPLGSDLRFPYDNESFDLVFSVAVMHHNPMPAKKSLLAEMWRVARPGGRLLFLEDFVAARRSEGSTVYPISVLGFVGLLLEATNGQVVLEHVESLRYLHEDATRSGIIAVSKLGVPKRW
jgi:hypothetical protein